MSKSFEDCFCEISDEIAHASTNLLLLSGMADTPELQREVEDAINEINELYDTTITDLRQGFENA